MVGREGSRTILGAFAQKTRCKLEGYNTKKLPMPLPNGNAIGNVIGNSFYAIGNGFKDWLSSDRHVPGH